MRTPVNRLQRAAPGDRAALAEHELDLVAADKILVAVGNLATFDALLVEPGTVGRAEILNEVVGAFANDDCVLPGDLSGADHVVAVLSAADQETIPIHLALLSILAHDEQTGLPLAGGRLAVFTRGKRAREGRRSGRLAPALDHLLQLGRGLQDPLGDLAVGGVF